jgi:hypothetical protein
MGDLLQGLCTLFSSTSKPKPLFEKTAKQPFVDVLASVKKLLESSDNPEWKSLTTQLEIAQIGASGHYFIYPISHSENDIKKNCYTTMYVRQSTLKDFNQACIGLLKTPMAPDQRDTVWEALLAGSKILSGDAPDTNKIGLAQDKATETQQQIALKPL